MNSGPADIGLLLAEAFPERIARARGAGGEFLLAGGRGAYVDPADPLAKERWLAVAQLAGGGPRDRIQLAARLDERVLLQAFEDRLVVDDRIEPDSAGRVQARRLRRLGAIIVDERPLEHPSSERVVQILLDQVRREGLPALRWSSDSDALRARVALLRQLEGEAWPDLSHAALMDALDDWLAPVLEGCRSLGEASPAALTDALKAILPWDRLQALERLAPERWQAPTGSRLAIDYGAEGGPTVSVRVQELFGLTEHPSVAGGRTPLVLSLLSPAHRPIQVTRDLPGFWRGSWKAVRADMRGRYPKHPWPENPASAPATTRAKPRA